MKLDDDVRLGGSKFRYCHYCYCWEWGEDWGAMALFFLGGQWVLWLL